MTLNKTTLNLRQFVRRQQVLRLYRNILRTARKIPYEEDEKYFLTWIRNEFKKNMHQMDEHAIKACIKMGESALEELKQSLKMSGN